MTTHTSYCRYCPNSCPVLVDVEDGVITNVRGDPANAVFGGYSCVKGRAAPEMHNHPQRLLHSLKRRSDGELVPIAIETAMDEIAERLSSILDHHGPRAVASYYGTATMASPLIEAFLNGFMSAIKSRMKFTPNTIDKPGKQLALAMHGRWMAPLQGYNEPDVALVLGANPFKTYYGVACGNPGTWLGERLRAGMQLVVVDPRTSDLARRATLHLQPVPGEDPAILAGLINVIISEGRYDRAFIRDNATGLDELARAVAPFTPGFVARRADIDADDLVRAARLFAGAARGYVACGVGPGFSASTTLVEYLALNLETLCGHWLRAGEPVTRDATLLPPREYKAQAAPPRPAYGYGERLRVHGLTETPAGLPTGVLADEMLLEGEGQVRALLSVGGNPANAWPDQLKVVDALRQLDLLVQVDPWLSSTARLADYVIAPRMPYETPAHTLFTDFIVSVPTWYGPAESYAQYTPAIVEPPPGSDVVGEWEFFFGLAQRMGLSLRPRLTRTAGGSSPPLELDMEAPLDPDELLARLTDGSRVPLDEVKQHPHGASFPEPRQVVKEKDAGWEGRLDLANGDMMADLATLPERLTGADPGVDGDAAFPMRLICRRLQQVMNSSLHDRSTQRGRGYNPLWVHPADLAELGLSAGDTARVSSARASIFGVVEPDTTLRRGLVAMAHGFGDSPERDERFREIGSPTSRLLDNGDFADRYIGMPRMSNIPVALRKVGEPFP